MKRLLVATAPLLGLLLLPGCKPAAPPSAELPVRTVRADTVGTGDVVTTVELVGELFGIEEVRVFPQVSDRLRSLPVREGQHVKQGEVLAVINADLQSEAVNQAQAGLEAAIAGRDSANDNLRRTRELVLSGSVSQSQLEALEAQARAAEAQVRQAAAGLGTASAHRTRAVVRAPISGVVAQLNFRAGDMVAPTGPLLTLVRDQRVKAVFRVPERDFLKIVEGQPLGLQPLADPGVRVAAQVTLKGPVVDRMTRTGLIEAHLDNEDRRLVAGSSVRGTVELERRPNVVLVPAEAVMLTGQTERTGLATAFVTDGKLAKVRQVQVGVRQGGQIEIVRGLSEGERLVVQGAHFLRDGSPVNVVGPAAPEGGR
jgi:RND family efflux transporter MFP subunit